MPTNIIFLTLSVANKLRVVCDVIENEFSHGKKVVINVADEEEGKTLDNMLWSWKQSSFIPHNYSSLLTDSKKDPVIITTDINDSINYDTLILVCPTEVENFSNFKTVIDFAEKYNPTKLESDRKRYKLYRDKKYKLESINPGEYLHN